MDTLGKNIMDPTSRLVVRFVMGRPQPEFREAIREEMKRESLVHCCIIYGSDHGTEYNDIVIVPMRENMNDGKTFAFFDWTFKHALVPPPTNATSTTYQNSYHETRNREHASDDGRPHRHGWSLYRPFESMPPASHDPLGPDGKQYIDKEGWVRPDYLVKVDDDSFIMLAELEARLRVLPRKGVYWGCESPSLVGYCCNSLMMLVLIQILSEVQEIPISMQERHMHYHGISSVIYQPMHTAIGDEPYLPPPSSPKHWVMWRTFRRSPTMQKSGTGETQIVIETVDRLADIGKGSEISPSLFPDEKTR